MQYNIDSYSAVFIWLYTGGGVGDPARIRVVRYGRYDIMLEPKNQSDDAIIIEFKVHHPKKEADLEDTVKSALQQIEEKRYTAALELKGIARSVSENMD